MVGGDKKECDIVLKEAQIVEYQYPLDGEDLVSQSYDLKQFYELEGPRIIDPSKYGNIDEFFDDLEKWWVYRQGRKVATFQKRRTLLKSLMNHAVFPIDVLHLNPDQIDACIQFNKRNYSKETARSGKDAIRNQLKAIFMVAQAQGIDYSKWNIKMPKRGKPKHKIVPLPQTVHKLIHSKYSADPYVNALYQYLAVHGFLVGPRIASEFSIMRLRDVHIEDGYLHFYQPKVDDWRMSPMEPEVMMMVTRKSYKNWIDKWRSKVENQYSKDYVYLRPDGKPFTEQGLRTKLNKMFKPIWSDFHPYCMRDWCAIARLIRTKVNSGSYDFYEVFDWFEHSDISVTQYYTKDANRYYKLAPFDWIKAVLKSQKNLREENSLKSKKPENEALSIDFSPVELEKLPWVRTPLRREASIANGLFCHCSISFNIIPRQRFN